MCRIYNPNLKAFSQLCPHYLHLSFIFKQNKSTTNTRNGSLVHIYTKYRILKKLAVNTPSNEDIYMVNSFFYGGLLNWKEASETVAYSLNVHFKQGCFKGWCDRGPLWHGPLFFIMMCQTFGVKFGQVEIKYRSSCRRSARVWKQRLVWSEKVIVWFNEQRSQKNGK